MSTPSKIALVAVTRRGVEQAHLLRTRLRAGEVHRPERYGPARAGWEHLFACPLAERIPELFGRCEQLVFFLAAGAVTRLIAPCLRSKERDPGVLAVDEAGRFVVPLLSGHKGGANAFAHTVAGCLGATPVITTASDVIGGLSLDLLEDSFGWVAEPRDQLKAKALALVNGERVTLIQEVGGPGCWLDEQELPAHVLCVRDVSQLPGPIAGPVVWITDRLVPAVGWVESSRPTGGEVQTVGLEDSTHPTPETAQLAERVDHLSSPQLAPRVDHLPRPTGEPVLWFRPRSLVLGIGCERGLPALALEEGLDRFLQEHGYARASVATLASVDLKADEPALAEVACEHGWEMVFYSAEELAGVPGMPNPSPVVARCVGTPGVAEPAALLASGAERLLVEKQVLTSPLAPQRMTFALARLRSFERAMPGKGKVVFVGAGPGDPDLLTLKGKSALGRAQVVVYAGSLVPEQVLRHAPATAELHNSAPLTLEEVMERLVQAARSGKRVVRLHSGDTSLYSAIQEQMTLLDEAGIDYEVIPGVSSFQAAAAALGVELTLPEVVQTVILTRAEGQTRMPAGEALADLARHRATLCIFLSARLAERVQEQLLTAYEPDTATALLYRVSWPDEKVIRCKLKDLAQEIRNNGLTRTTLIVVGEAVGRRQNRSRLYDKHHGHLFRARSREEQSPSP